MPIAKEFASPERQDGSYDDSFTERATRYMRDRSLDDMRADMQEQMRAHPLATVLIGVAAGFLMGKMLRR